ncbi:PREDICTED: indole glucosinolate O-methyltransferase 4-like [Tarenaya hassleriana]|uniref:indole glucosinolate O-methyltransferase 4-like n=1 Tax=Tarenaya hassleriana TaxID=28532 RepID=UPI00053C9F40|nr:PREDICTED: indole glucosinolate O-methyltransferase 4-like [Tarenaya hassleriana]
MDKHFDPNPRPDETLKEETRARAIRIANAVAFPMALKAAFQLGVIQTLSAAGEGAWLSPSDIARALPTRPTNPQAPMLLDRMLRVLTSYEIVKCRTGMVQAGETGPVYAADPVCRFFLNADGESGSLEPLFMLLHCDVVFKAWNNLKDMIQDGRDAFISAHGTRFFEYEGTNYEGFGELFNRAMSESTVMNVKNVLEVYRGFEDVNVLVDVGGGIGTGLAIIISKYSKIKGINFDLAGVLANAPPHPGVEHVVGDMFVDIPKGDAIFMNRILHSWTDEDCLKILENCRKALTDTGKVIMMELVSPDRPGRDVYSNIILDYDMLMLSQCSGAKERTKAEFEELAFGSGFIHCEFVCCSSPYWVIEFRKEANA